MNVKQVIYKGVAKTFAITEPQVESLIGNTAMLNRPALLREVDGQELAHYESMDAAAWIRWLKSMGLNMPKYQKLFEKNIRAT